MRCGDEKSEPMEVFGKSVQKGKKQVEGKRRF